MNILIVEDNETHAKDLTRILAELGETDVDICADAEEAIREIEEEILHPAMAIIDIKLKGIDGIKFAKHIRRHMPTVQIVFMSAYDDYYLNVYEVDHAFFLKKPLTKDKVDQACERVRDRIVSTTRDCFSYTSHRTRYMVPFNSILFFEKDKRRVIIHTDNDKHIDNVFYEVMEELMRKLPDCFVRCHNSYVVNILRVDAYRKCSFIIGDKSIPISRRYEAQARDAFLESVDRLMRDSERC